MNEEEEQEAPSAYSGLLSHFHVTTHFLMLHVKNVKGKNFL